MIIPLFVLKHTYFYIVTEIIINYNIISINLKLFRLLYLWRNYDEIDDKRKQCIKYKKRLKNYCKKLGKVIIYKITKKYTNKGVLKSPIGSCKKEEVFKWEKKY